MNPKLDRAIDLCAADMARGVRGTVGQGLPESFWTALKLMDAVRRDADGHEAVERLKLDWLVEQTLARLVARIEAGLKRRLPADAAPAVAEEIWATYAAVLADIQGIFDRAAKRT